MPKAAPRPCNHPACKRLVENASYCEEHAKLKRKQADAKRESSTQRGYGYRWQKTSEGYLKAHPVCVCLECVALGIAARQAEVVDHIIPHRGDMNLFWNPDNWQPMAKVCHDKKTATEDGGFTGYYKQSQG